jgi:hypothetical protein
MTEHTLQHEWYSMMHMTKAANRPRRGGITRAEASLPMFELTPSSRIQ